MLSAWVLGRPGPIDVYGPPGTADMTRHIEEAYREDIGVRTYGLEPKHAARGYRAVTHEVRAGRVYEDAKVKVDAIPVLHGAWPEAFGYRIQTPDRTIVVSGDTRPAPAIAEACNGCDVLIHEVYSTARARSGEWQAYDRAYHTSTSELAAIATQAKPRLLVLYHQMPRGFVDTELEQEVAKAGYTGRIISARDLDVF
jgi:ribonuclease BN (tRNA processing enzyme)